MGLLLIQNLAIWGRNPIYYIYRIVFHNLQQGPEVKQEGKLKWISGTQSAVLVTPGVSIYILGGYEKTSYGVAKVKKLLFLGKHCKSGPHLGLATRDPEVKTLDLGEPFLSPFHINFVLLK
jgi:hypothetical protein